MTRHDPQITILLETAREAAYQTGELIREKWSQPRQIKNKGFRDLVTDTDTAAQKLITDAIRAQFPEHGFLTEEDDSDLPTSGPVIWVIDPVDGTTKYGPVTCGGSPCVVDLHGTWTDLPTQPRLQIW